MGNSPQISLNLDFIIICRYCIISAFHVKKIFMTNSLAWAFYSCLYSVMEISLAYIWRMFKLFLFTLIVLVASRCFQRETYFKDTQIEDDDWKLALEKRRDKHRYNSSKPFVSPSAVLSNKTMTFFLSFATGSFIWLAMCPLR